MIAPKQATVLATEEDGSPVVLKSVYGKGVIYLFTFPLEENLTHLTGAFDKAQPAYANIYKEIARPFLNEQVLIQLNTFIGVTEHPVSASEKIVVLINYSTAGITINPVIKEGWKTDQLFYGDAVSAGTLIVKAKDAVVLSLQIKK